MSRTVTGPSSPSKPRAPASLSYKPCSPTVVMPVASKPWARTKASLALSIVRPPRTLAGFELAAPLGHQTLVRLADQEPRRLVRDFDQHPETSETLITIAAATTLIRRLRWTFLNALLVNAPSYSVER